MTDQQIAATAAHNTETARQLLRDTGIIEIWQSIGAEVHTVGSLSMGLLVKHRDIDLHFYTPSISIADDFEAISRFAENPAVRQVYYGNLLDTEEACLEWHAWVADSQGELWQLDMMHIAKGSRYDGYFEQVAARIVERLTDRTRKTIMRLKWECPETEKIAGIEYYQAVLRDGIETFADFMQWRQEHPLTGVAEWMP